MVDKRYKYNNKNRNLAGNPIHQPTESYKKGWDRIFGKKKTESEKLQDELKPIDFKEQADKEQKELDESMKESFRQRDERKAKDVR